MTGARIHPTALVESDVTIGGGTAVWDHAHLRSGARVGRDCIIGEKAYLAGGVIVGDRVKINACAYLCAGVHLADGVMVAAHVVFTNDRFPRATDPDLRELLTSAPGPATEATFVGRGATLGANATIGPGLRIGEFAMVGMGAVVVADVPAHGLVVGNPARLVGLVGRDGKPVLRLQAGEGLPAHARVACDDGGVLLVASGVVRWEPV